jgi:dihydrofolate reductase
MRTVIARIFDYSLDGVIATTEGTPFFDFCRELPDDPAQEDHNRALYARADLHVMGRVAYQGMAGYFPTATDHPYADLMNAARKVVFSRTLTDASWANSTIASGDLATELDALKRGGDGTIVAALRLRAPAEQVLLPQLAERVIREPFAEADWIRPLEDRSPVAAFHNNEVS